MIASTNHTIEMPTHRRDYGRDGMASVWTSAVKRCGPRRDAIRKLVDGFSHISFDWLQELAEHRGEYLPLPMWGTLFIPKESADVSNIKKLLVDIQPDNEDDDEFASAGWQEVADTGIYAVDFDDELLLGIHDAGYDFYSYHWARLYDALGYRWHE
jgi:hypothetical protein